MSYPTVSIKWRPAWRVIPSRFPALGLFERVARPEDFDALYALEAMTNDRLRDEVGDIALVPPEERLFGPGSTCIMAAFTHLNPHGSRFSDGSYGVFYCARHRATAIAETRYRACPEFCVNGPLAGNCRLLVRRHNEHQETRRT